MTAESMESFRQARETKAEGWRCSFVGPEVPETGNGRGRKRRTRVVKRTRLAKAKAAPKTKSKKNKKNKNKNKKDKKGKSKKQKANKEAKPPIPAVAGNFSRSKKGDKLIQQEMVMPRRGRHGRRLSTRQASTSTTSI